LLGPAFYSCPTLVSFFCRRLTSFLLPFCSFFPIRCSPVAIFSPPEFPQLTPPCRKLSIPYFLRKTLFFCPCRRSFWTKPRWGSVPRSIDGNKRSRQFSFPLAGLQEGCFPSVNLRVDFLSDSSRAPVGPLTFFFFGDRIASYSVPGLPSIRCQGDSFGG